MSYYDVIVTGGAAGRPVKTGEPRPALQAGRLAKQASLAFNPVMEFGKEK